MKKTNALWILLDSLFLIVFNVLFFMFVYDENITNTVWISYGFIHFAYLLMLTSPLFVKRGEVDYIYRRPLYAITTTYFLIELIAGTVLILIFPDEYTIAVVSQVILAAIFIAWLLAHIIANEHTADSVTRRAEDLQYIKVSASLIKSISAQVSDKQINKKIGMLYDLLHSSPTKSSVDARLIEQEIIKEIESLDRAVACHNTPDQITEIVSKIYHLAEKRNRKLKAY